MVNTLISNLNVVGSSRQLGKEVEDPREWAKKIVSKELPPLYQVGDSNLHFSAWR